MKNIFGQMVAALAITALFGAMMVGCTDAERASIGSYGDRATVTCYSGAQIVFETESTGKVMQLDGDGIAFRNAKTGKFVRAFADCIVEQQ